MSDIITSSLFWAIIVGVSWLFSLRHTTNGHSVKHDIERLQELTSKFEKEIE